MLLVATVSAVAAGVVGLESLAVRIAAGPQASIPVRAAEPSRGGAGVPAPDGCPVPAPSTAAGYQAMFDAPGDAGTGDVVAGRTEGWVGGDQAASVALPDGRTLWMFGDTLLGSVTADGTYTRGTRMVHNSFVLQDRGCLDTVDPAVGTVLPDPRQGAAEDVHYWPQTGVVDGGELVVFAARIEVTGQTLSDFRAVGSDLAVYALADGQDPVLRSMEATPSSDAGPQDTKWGAAVVTSGGHHYVYGVRNVEAPLAFGTSVQLARVRVGELADAAAWTFFDGTRYVSDPAAAAVLDGADAAAGRGWSQSFSVHTSDGRFVAVYKELDFLGDRVRVAVADDPSGPFTEVDSFESPSSAEIYTYTALAHPQLALDGGELLVGVSRNSPHLRQVLTDADLYRPQFRGVKAGG